MHGVSCVQPGNLFTFGAQFFAEKRNASARASDVPKVDSIPAAHVQPLSNVSDSDDYQQLSEAVYGMISSISSALSRCTCPILLNQMLCHADCFKNADSNGDGTLDRHEFAEVLASSRLSLGQQVIDRVLAEADDNDDGVIQYKCVPR